MGMKILFIIESPSMGGAEKVLVDIANGLVSNHCDITVCSLFKNSIYGNEHQFDLSGYLTDSVNYRYLFNNDKRSAYSFASFFITKAPAWIYRLRIRGRYDRVVAFYEGVPTRFVSKARLKYGKKIAWLHTLTALSMKRLGNKQLAETETLYCSFDKVVAVSNSVARSFSNLFPSVAEKLVVAYNPVNIKNIQSLSEAPFDIQKPDCPLLVSVGRITKVKGYDRYLRVIRHLRADGFHFKVWIIGGGDRSALETYCNDNHLDNVHFWGSQDNPYPFMKYADWIVLPSKIEGLPTVILESLALGKATIATDCGGTREILGCSEYGLMVDNDKHSLYSGIKTALSDCKMKSLYEKKASLRVHLFETSSCTSRIEKVLEG